MTGEPRAELLASDGLDKDAVGALALGALRTHAERFLANLDAARAGTDGEPVHQMRVATRRLRAGLKLFSDVLPTDAEALRGELKWIAAELGAVRDLDVQIERTRHLAAELDLSCVGAYLAWLGARRGRHRHALLGAFDAPRFAALTEQLQHGLAEWQLPPTADVPAREWAPPQLTRAFKKLNKRAKRVDAQSPAAELHQVRIAAKRVRYAVEFFEPTYGAAAKAMVERTVALQDLLGGLQDGVVARELMQSALASSGAAWPGVTAFALGQLAEHERTQAAEIRAAFPKTIAALRRKGWRPLGRAMQRDR